MGNRSTTVASARRRRIAASLSVLALLLFAFASPAAAGEVSLAWDASPDVGARGGYRVYYGPSTGNYTDSVDVGNVTSTTITGLTDGETYYFSSTAYDSAGNESVHSNEISSVAPPGGETISSLRVPEGTSSGLINEIYPYVTGDAVSSYGDPVQYRFSWGDGTLSNWLPTGTEEAEKSWSVEGTYAVCAEARCVTHTAVGSGLTDSLQVSISAGGGTAETVSAPVTPAGPSVGAAGSSRAGYEYSTAGSSSSEGHDIEYRFDWGDGTSSGWLPAGTTEASKTWVAPGIYGVRAESRCSVHNAVHSGYSGQLNVQIEPGDEDEETVTAPAAPDGPPSGMTAEVYVYATGGSASSIGHSVQYQFDWGDGSTSGWLPAGTESAGKVWDFPGGYQIRVEARCVDHNDVLSEWSGAFSVAISGVEGVLEEIGVFRGGEWHWDSDNNGMLEEGFDLVIGMAYAEEGSVPVLADLDGDGIVETGTFSGGQWYFDVNGDGVWEEGVDTVFGKPMGDLDLVPVPGDVDGDGIDEIGVYKDGYWYFDLDGDGNWQKDTDLLLGKFGDIPGMVPLVGDMNGDGYDDIGAYSDGYWYFDLNGDGKWKKKADLVLGKFGGIADLVPVVGDVDGDGIEEIGVYLRGKWYFDLNNNGTWEKDTDAVLGVFGGQPGDVPVMGNVQ